MGPIDARGYHPLETQFQAIALFDDLILTTGQSGFTITGPESHGLDPADRSNTVNKTLRLMREVATLPEFSIELVKRIPSQAGLGGGSSDAAGLLRGLRHLLPSTVPQRDFEMVARGVGADVSYFLVGGRADGTGYGEVLTPLPDPQEEWLVVAMPEARCSTAEMYGRLDTLPALSQDGVNSFHAVAPSECLAAIDVMLKVVGLTNPTLAGSGAAVFGFAANQESAEVAAAQLVARGLPSWPTKTLPRAESLAIETLA